MDAQATQDQQNAIDKPAVSKKILLVEDDQALSEVYMARLQAENFDVKRAATGEEALQIISGYTPDLVLLDLLLPKLSGFEVLASIRSNAALNNVKVVVLTSLDNDENHDRAINLGANEYLVKSRVVLADVIDRVKHILGM